MVAGAVDAGDLRKKIDEINALIAKLKAGQDFPLSDAEKAIASPNSAPY